MVIKAKVPGRMSYSLRLMIEEFFYETAARSNLKLRRISLSRFERSERIGPYLGKDKEKLIRYAVGSRKLHGIIMPDGSFILHPDGCYKEIGKRGQKYLKSLTVLPRNLRRFLKNLPQGTTH